MNLMSNTQYHVAGREWTRNDDRTVSLSLHISPAPEPSETA